MSILIKGGEFIPAPDGIHSGICVDAVDLGIVESTFGKKHMVKLVWEIEAKMDDGRPFLVQKRYTASLHEKSSLAKDLRSWRGKPFTPEEMKGFDIEKVVGAPCQLVIVHAEKEGAVYANVQNVAKSGDKKLAPSGKYVRFKDRPADQRQNGNGGNRPPQQRQPGEEDAPGEYDDGSSGIPF